MPQDKAGGNPRGGPSKSGPGGDRRDGRRPGGGRDGSKKGGFGKGPGKPARAETYETLKEIQRGAGFRIDKFLVAEKGTHKPVKTEYRLIREGLNGPKPFDRLAEAQAAAIAPLPEPLPPEAEPEAPAETTETAEAVALDSGESGEAPLEGIGTPPETPL